MISKILFIELNGFKPLPLGGTLRIISSDLEVKSVTDLNSALIAIDRMEKLDILVCNATNYEIFRAVRQKHHNAFTILITEHPMREYSPSLNNEEEILVDHIIANRFNEAGMIHELRVTLNKIVSKDIFGIEKYLSPGTEVFRYPITGSQDRDEYNSKVMLFAEACRLGQHTAKMVFGITEEMLMNVIFDAPVAGGVAEYNHASRAEVLKLRPEEYGELTYGCDGNLFIISTSDPFGALTKEKLLTYLKKVLKRRDSVGLIDTKKGGAGLGFFKMLYSSHTLICNVEKNAKTEMMTIIDIEEQLRDFATMPRSIHYFQK